jgi:misacylated tRNA(Ala) deacylase
MATSIYECHLEPDRYDFTTRVVADRPGAVALERSWLHPGGGGQPPDRATLACEAGTFTIVGVETDSDHVWHLIDTNDAVIGEVAVTIDQPYRSRVAQLHTATHVLNALVFQHFDGALVTGAKINGDGTAHMDFDLPNVDNDHLRALESEINDVVRGALDVRATYVGVDEAASIPGLVRNLAVAPPPTPDGRLRVIEIVGLDRQACGGTHLTNTAQSAPIRVTKVDNKGRRNRRVRIALVET